MNIGHIAGACMTIRIASAMLEKDIGITPQQLVFLDFVADGNGSFTMGDLANYMNVTPAVCTGLADRLVKRGYLVRVPADRETGDRRVTYLAVTELGRDVLGLASAALEGAN